MLRMLGHGDGMILKLPFGAGWTDERDMPAPAARTFREQYQARTQIKEAK